jgi:hypothetical protein
MSDDLPTLRRKLEAARRTRGHEDRAVAIEERIAELEALG